LQVHLHPSQCISLTLAISHLAEAWGHFVHINKAVTVTTRMRRLLLLCIPKTSHYCHNLFLRNYYSGMLWVSTQDS